MSLYDQSRGHAVRRLLLMWAHSGLHLPTRRPFFIPVACTTLKLYRLALVMIANLVLAAVAAAFVVPKQIPVPAPLQNVHRIVCLGDSITQMGESQGGYVWLFRRYLNAIYPSQNIEVINAG